MDASTCPTTASGTQAALRRFLVQRRTALAAWSGERRGRVHRRPANATAIASRASRVGDDGSVKLRLGLDPADHPLAIEADGALRLEDNAPRFDGTLTLSRPAAVGAARRARHGRGAVARERQGEGCAGRRRCSSSSNINYGPDDRAIRLTGTAEFRFGKSPRFESVLSARQVDLDRALALPEAPGRLPLAALKAFIEPLDHVLSAAIPGAARHRRRRGDARGRHAANRARRPASSTATSWDIETLEFRAPGFAQVRLERARGADRRRRDASRDRRRSKQAIRAHSSPGSRAAADAAQAPVRDCCARAASSPSARSSSRSIGSSSSSTARRSKGRIAYAGAIGGKPPRARRRTEGRRARCRRRARLRPRGARRHARLSGRARISLSVDIGRATLAGIDVKGVSGTLQARSRRADVRQGAHRRSRRCRVQPERPHGRRARCAARHRDVRCRCARPRRHGRGAREIFARRPPSRCGRPRRKITPLKAQVTLGIEPVSSTEPRGKQQGQARARRHRRARCAPSSSAEAAGDVGALTLPDFQLDGQIAADRRRRADRRCSGSTARSRSTSAPASLSVAMRGASGADAQLDARLTAGGLAAGANGTARLFSASGLAAALDLTLAGGGRRARCGAAPRRARARCCRSRCARG